MISVLTERGEHVEAKNERPHEDAARDWRDAALSQDCQGVGNWRRQGTIPL